jgi:hypothetical protein
MFRQNRIESDSVLDKFYEATEDVTLNVRQTLVYANSTAGAFTITLPPVSEAKGLIFTIYMTADGGDVTIADSDDSKGWDGDYTLNDVDDGKAFYSDGVGWWTFVAKS